MLALTYILHSCVIMTETLPVIVVHVLAYECVRLHSAICIHLRHIHVVYEVDQSSATRRSIVTSCFLLKRLFQHRYVGEE